MKKRKRKDYDKPISFRLSAEDYERIDAIKKRLPKLGIKASDVGAIRYALAKAGEI